MDGCKGGGGGGSNGPTPPERPPKKAHLRPAHPLPVHPLPVHPHHPATISPDQEMRRIEASAHELMNLNTLSASVMRNKKPPAPDPPQSPPLPAKPASPVNSQQQHLLRPASLPVASGRTVTPELPLPPPPCTSASELMVIDDPLPPPPSPIILDSPEAQRQSPPLPSKT